MTVFVIKLIAYVTMLIDHLSLAFVDRGLYPKLYFLGRGIGRIAFPLFAWMIVEGYFHTKNLRKYLLRLAIMTVLSEPGFDLVLILSGDSAGFSDNQNVCLTLFLGLVSVVLIDRLRSGAAEKPFLYTGLSVLVIVGTCTLAFLAKSDYAASGVILILLFYFLRGRFMPLMWGVFLWAVFLELAGYAMEEIGMVSVLLIHFCNGELGPKIGKRLNYYFYPVHLLIIGLIKWAGTGFAVFW